MPMICAATASLKDQNDGTDVPLRRGSCRVLSADDALRVIETELPDVIVTDLGMPRVDGFQLLERIRGHRNPLVRHVPAAALTAYARSEDRVKALRAGFQIHLAKPIDPTEPRPRGWRRRFARRLPR